VCLPASNPGSRIVSGFHESPSDTANSNASNSAGIDSDASAPKNTAVASSATGPSMTYSRHSVWRMGRSCMLSKKPTTCGVRSTRSHSPAHPGLSSAVTRARARSLMRLPRRSAAGTDCRIVTKGGAFGWDAEIEVRLERTAAYGAPCPLMPGPMYFQLTRPASTEPTGGADEKRVPISIPGPSGANNSFNVASNAMTSRALRTRPAPRTENRSQSSAAAASDG
jgi:hypothetical protein